MNRTSGRPLLGVTYLIVLGLLMAYCAASFRQALPWQRKSTLVIKTKHAGLQLSTHADVKLQGVTVGEVRNIASNGRDATITLAIDPHRLAGIPANVAVQITPKTLFGAKYVSLQMPSTPAGHVASGNVIHQSETSVELDELFNELVPLLRALDPAQLSLTLNAISQALHGRGSEVGATLAKLNGYLGELNPQLPALVKDVSRMADVADIYTAALPNITQILDNARATTQEVLVPHEGSLADMLKAATRATNVTNQTLSANASKIITLAGRSEAIERVLAEYSSEYPCLIHSLTRLDQLTGKAFEDPGPYLRVSIDVVTHHDAYSYPADSPSGPKSDANVANLPDGTHTWAPYCPVETAQMRASLPQAGAPASAGGQTTSAAPAAAAQTPADAMARSIAAQSLGVDAGKVPSISMLLLKPLLGPGEVTVR
jgi:phospholipid/cholesterol/gamma-HCH transport system substrate-binding protein